MSAVLTIESPAGSGRFVLARGAALVLGRSLQADLSVDDLRVSRRHCRLEHGDRGIVVADMRSANGTFVNGKRITKALLRPGDKVQVGNAELKVGIEYTDEDYLQRSYACDSCKRAISLMTFADGDVIQVADRFICPQCREKQATPEFTLIELDLVQRLAAEGFEVLEKLSISGVVPIYKARKTALDQLVALKALPLSGAVSQKKVTRFVQEAKTQARLRHRNIVAIYDVRSLPDLIYIVMEIIEGETLLQAIQRSGSRLAVRESVRIGYQVARALAHAHEKGIIHRDVKPSNIMLAQDGEAKLIDFGLAKNLHELSMGITADGETLGTIGYMAPEQVRTAKLADHRADVYGLGATLFHCLTGRPPFNARSEAQLADEIQRGPPLHLLADLPPAVGQLVVKMMSRRPEDRHQSPDEMLRAVEAVVTDLTGIAASAQNVEFLLKVRDEESDHLLQTWRHSRPARQAGFLGSFREQELIEFLQMLEFNLKSGTLTVAGPGGVRGNMTVSEGRIVSAECAGERGARAVTRILGLRQGDFEFAPGDLPGEFHCDLKISQVLLDAMRVKDERRTPRS